MSKTKTSDPLLPTPGRSSLGQYPGFFWVGGSNSSSPSTPAHPVTATESPHFSLGSQLRSGVCHCDNLSPLLAAQLDTSQKNKVFLKLSINQLAKETQIFSCPSHWDGAARTRITRIFWGHPNSITFQKRCICLSQYTAFISYKISGFEAQFPS